MKTTTAQKRIIIQNAILTQQIELKHYEGLDYAERINPQVIRVERYIKGTIDTLQAVQDMLNGNNALINLLINRQ